MSFSTTRILRYLISLWLVLLVVAPFGIAAQQSPASEARDSAPPSAGRVQDVAAERSELQQAEVTVEPLGNITTISTGSEHTCVLTNSGGVKCWGNNSRGQLGDGTTTNRSYPGDVVGLTNGVRELSSGFDHTCALLTTGGIKCWGKNEYGQIGNGQGGYYSWEATPTIVQGLPSGAKSIGVGGVHTCAVLQDGSVWCWGRNDDGQLGDGTYTDRKTPIEVMGLNTAITSVGAGHYHTCALTQTGGVKCWGQNLVNQLGDGTTTSSLTPINVSGLISNVIGIQAGRNHTCSWMRDGAAKCWGIGDDGRLGDGTSIRRSRPVDVLGMGTGVSTIGSRVYHSCAALLTGGVKCWGWNYDGQLGVGIQTPYESTPVTVANLTVEVVSIGAGSGHTCVVTFDGRVKCWGDNYSGQLGDGTTTNRLTPVDVLAGSPSSTPTPSPTKTPVPSTATPSLTPAPSTLEPIIFVPGVAGSYLYEGEDELWPAMHLSWTERDQRHRRLSLAGQSAGVGGNVVAPDIMRTIYVNLAAWFPGVVAPHAKPIYTPFLDSLVGPNGPYKEYDVAWQTSRRTTTGCDTNQTNGGIPTFFPFAYDWRKDIGYNADKLADYVGCVRKYHPTANINIIAHSMGGLVARRYIIDHSTDGIGKVITIGTPWLGAPKFINVLESGMFIDSFWERPFSQNTTVFKQTVPYLPGAAELLPGEEYWRVSSPPLRIETGFGASPLSYAQFVDLMNRRYPIGTGCSSDNNCRIGAWSRDFHNRTGQDRWLDSSAPIEYYYIYGVRSHADTIQSVALVRTNSCLRDIKGAVEQAQCYVYDSEDLSFGQGDGTVPIVSALRDVGDGFPVTRRPFSSQSEDDDENLEHGSLPNSPDILTYILGILLPEAQVANAATVAIPNELTMDDAYYVEVFGVPDGLVSDNAGAITGMRKGEFVGMAGAVSYFATGDHSFEVVLSTSRAYTLSLTAGEVPLLVDIGKGIADHSTAVYKYHDVVVPNGRSVAVYFAPGYPPVVKYDADGNGTPETPIVPSYFAEGASTLDTSGPDVVIQVDTRRQIMITATDSSGVRVVYYSFDGATFFRYSSPIPVPATASLLHAFAEDNKTNRSGVVTYQLASTKLFLPVVHQ